MLLVSSLRICIRTGRIYAIIFHLVLFSPTSSYSSCMCVLSRLNLEKVQLSTKGIYSFLLKVQSSFPGVHRVWAPYLGSGFSDIEYWAKVSDSADGKMNDVQRKQHPRSREFTWFNSDFSISSRVDKFYIY